MTDFLKLYAISFPTFFLIDLIWLGLVAKNFYSKHLGFIMSPTPNWAAAIIFYLLFIAGIILFCHFSRFGKKFLDPCITLRRTLWSHDLRHLRSHQSGYPQKLAAHRYHC